MGLFSVCALKIGSTNGLVFIVFLSRDIITYASIGSTIALYKCIDRDEA